MKVNNRAFCNALFHFACVHFGHAQTVSVSFDLYSDGFSSALTIHSKSGDVVASRVKKVDVQ